MGFSDQLRNAFILGPIVGLLLLGFLVSLQSGVASLSNRQGVQLFLSNLSQVLLRIFGYLAGLLAVQQFVGFPIELIW